MGLRIWDGLAARGFAAGAVAAAQISGVYTDDNGIARVRTECP